MRQREPVRARYPLDPLVEIMARLRSDQGCPWDRKQDHVSLKRYAIEEAHELVDAIDEALQLGDDAPLIEELGDLLLQVAFHAQIASESGRFDVGDVIEAICAKLVRRHPHVFGGAVAADAEAVERRWEEIKREEKGEKATASLLDGIPKGLPALAFAHAVQARAAKVGFEWKSVDGALEKVAEEVREIAAAAAAGQEPARLAEEWGDLLFSLVNVARYAGVDLESALRSSALRFQRRFQYIEARAAEAGRDLETMSLAEMDALWEEAKKSGRA